MQAIILAAGKGSRIKEITVDEPKSLLKIKDKRLIDINLNLLTKHGIEDIVLVTGYQCAALEPLLQKYPSMQEVFNPFYEVVNVIGSFWIAQEKLYDDFVYIHADTLCEESIFVDLLRDQSDIALPVDFSRVDEEAMKVKLTEDNSVVEINKTMALTAAAGEFIGIAKIAKRVIPRLKAAATELMKQKKFSEYFEAALQLMIDDGGFSIKAIPTANRFWAEIDFIEDFKKAEYGIPDALINF